MKTKNFDDYLIAAFLLFTALAFYRDVINAFDLVKYTGGLLIVGTLIWRALQISWLERRDFKVISVWIAFLGIVLSGLVSDFRNMALYGQYQRYTGVFWLAGCLAVALATMASPRASHSRIVVAIRVCAIGVTIYAAMQVLDIDPFVWQSTSFGRFVFGTIGNPNTAAGYLAVVFPFLFHFSWTATSWMKVSTGPLLALGFFALGNFQSANIFVALLPTGIYVLIRHIRKPVIAEILVTLLSATNLASFFLAYEKANLLLFVTSALSAAVTIPNLTQKILSPNRITELIAAHQKAVAWGVLGVATTTLLLVRDTISSEWTGGLVERRFFYDAALAGFRDSPIFGHGWESFGNYFPVFRSSEAAATYETSLTSSVHSIPLAFLFSGGLFLIAFITPLLVVISQSLVGNLRKFSDGSESESLFAFSFFAFVLQSIFNVEHVAHYAIAAVLVGSLLRLPDTKQDLARRRVSRGRHFMMAAAGVLAVTPVALRPYIADRFRLQTLELASQNSGVPVVTPVAMKAYSWASWESTFSFAAGELQYLSGDCEQGVEILQRAVESSNYSLLIAPKAAVIMFNCGDTEMSRETIERSLELNPGAKGLSETMLSIVDEAITTLGEDEQNLAAWQDLNEELVEQSRG